MVNYLMEPSNFKSSHSAYIKIDDKGDARTLTHNVKVKMIGEWYFFSNSDMTLIAQHYEIPSYEVEAAVRYYHDNWEAYEQRQQENILYLLENGHSLYESAEDLKNTWMIHLSPKSLTQLMAKVPFGGIVFNAAFAQFREHRKMTRPNSTDSED